MLHVRAIAFGCFVSGLALSPAMADPKDEATGKAGPGKYRCEPVIANGKQWTQLTGKQSNAFYIDAVCPYLDSPGKEYFPTGGGFMYDGAAEDPSLMNDWRVMTSVPYDRTNMDKPDQPSQPAKAWRCVVRWMGKGPPPGKPETIWCWANCCHW